MSSIFYSFEIAKKGLFASQRAIDVVGHNIANANTVGYTRQRLALEAINAPYGGTKFASAEKGQVGGCVDIKTVDQIRNVFLDRQYRNENTQSNEWMTEAEGLAYVESLFDETQDTGISQSVNEFFNSLNELSKSPASTEYRTNVVQNTLKMTETFNHYYTQLADKQAEQNDNIKVLSIQVNDISRNIAELNTQVSRFELGGEKANDLRDKRNVLLDELSSFADIKYSETTTGAVNVTLGGKYLVEDGSNNNISVSNSVINPLTGDADLYGLTWEDGTGEVDITSGKIKGSMDLRDGNSASNFGIPYIIDGINKLASGLATAVNEAHRKGYTLPINGESEDNIDMFQTFKDADGNIIPITAKNIALDSRILGNTNYIATSSVKITNYVQNGNNENALAILDLRNQSDIPILGDIDGFLKSKIAEIAIETSHANNMLASQNALTESIDYQRKSFSGVSIDEEMTNLIKFQQTYNASARMITAIDEMLDIIVNRMGMVGR